MEKILENIEAIRKQKGINQEDMAKALGIKQPAYSNYITRESDITFSRLLQICKILETDVVDVIKYPIRYVPMDEPCPYCAEKDRIIKNLNDHLEVLKKRK